MIDTLRTILEGALERLQSCVIAYLPAALAALTLIVSAWLIASVGRWLLYRVVKGRVIDKFLRQSGLAVRDLARVWSDTVERDVVMAQDPPAGLPLEKGGGVGLLVSLGRKGRLSITPALIGKKAEEAVRVVDRLGLQYRVISRTSGTTPPSGDRTVVSQKPNAGYPLAADGVVELLMSR